MHVDADRQRGVAARETARCDEQVVQRRHAEPAELSGIGAVRKPLRLTAARLSCGKVASRSWWAARTATTPRAPRPARRGAGRARSWLSARETSQVPFGRRPQRAVVAAVVEERIAAEPAARPVNAAEEDDVIAGVDRIDDVAVEMRERLCDRRARALELTAFDELVEELRRSGRSEPCAATHTCVRARTLTPKTPAAPIARALAVSAPSETSTIGGSADTDANAVTVIPQGRPANRR